MISQPAEKQHSRSASSPHSQPVVFLHLIYQSQVQKKN